MAVNIERINKYQVDTILHLNETIFRNLITYDRSFIQLFCNKGNGFIVNFDAMAVGYILFDKTYNELAKKEVPTIVNIGILEKYRGMGFGKVLIKLTLEIYKNQDVYLHVIETNYKVQNLYKSFGFVILGTVQDYYDFPTGKENAYIMVRYSNSILK